MANKTFTYENDRGEDVEVDLPRKYEVCPTCDGHGKHSHAVDGNGITDSEWEEWDHEEREDYFAGRYDQTCEECNGKRVIQVVDIDAIPEEARKQYIQYLGDIESEQRATQYERRFVGNW